MLILVRHAMPAAGPQKPPEAWHLSEDGRRGAESLVHLLPADAKLISSPEPKALQTLEPAGRVTGDERFREVVRDEPYDGDFRARRHAYVTGTDLPGWERRAEVVARFDAGVAFWTDQAGPRPLVIASHGMALTLWLTSAVGLADAGEFWTELRLPDVFAVDLGTRRVARITSAQLFQLS